MKRKLCLILALALIFVTLAACGEKPASTPTPTPTPVSTPDAPPADTDEPPPVDSDPFADMEPVTIIMSTSKNERADAATVDFYNRVSERTGGKVKFDFYFSSSLVSSIRDVPEALAAGICDVTQMNMVNYTGIFPLNSAIIGVPFMGMSDETIGVYGELMELYPQLEEEYAAAGVKLLSYSITRPYNLHINTKKEYSSIADIAGIKIGGSTPNDMEILQSAGAVPVSVMFPEIYQSLEKGVINGVLNHSAAVFNTSWYEHANQHIIFGENSGMFVDVVAYVMRLDTWNSLPEAVQQVFLEEAEQFKGEDFQVMRSSEDKLIEYCENTDGHDYIILDEQEIQAWRDIAAPTIQKIIAEKNGVDPQFEEMYNKALELIAKAKG